MKKNILKNSLKYISIVPFLFAPIIAFAAPLGGVRGMLVAFKGLLNLTVPVVIGIALIYFLWGTAQFILHAGEQKSRDDGKKKMLWGIIALFVMFSIWGILGWIGNTIGIPVSSPSPVFQGDAIPGTNNG